MAFEPVVRYMILCEDWEQHTPRGVSIHGLLTNIRSLDAPPYPLVCRELCVFLALTEGRAQGLAQIVCVFEETGRKVFETPQRSVEFGSDPIEVVGLAFRIRDCCFPQPGVYSLQFWYDAKKLDERPLRLR